MTRPDPDDLAEAEALEAMHEAFKWLPIDQELAAKGYHQEPPR